MAALDRFDAESHLPNPSIRALATHAGAFEGNMHSLEMAMPNDLGEETRVGMYIRRVHSECHAEMERVRAESGSPLDYPRSIED